MKMVGMLIQVPEPIKARLDALRNEGTTPAGLSGTCRKIISGRLRG